MRFRFTKRKRIIEFSVGVFALAFLAVFSYINLSQLGNAVSWVKHTYLVRESLNNLELLVRTAESSQRGYLLTKKTFYLIEFNNSLDDISSTESYLINLLADNSVQTQRLKEAYTTIEQRIQILSAVIDLKEQGREDQVKIVVDSSKGKQFMDKFMTAVQELKGTEDFLLNSRLLNQERNLQASITAVIFGSVISLIIIFGAIRIASTTDIEKIS